MALGRFCVLVDGPAGHHRYAFRTKMVTFERVTTSDNGSVEAQGLHLHLRVRL